LIKASPKKGDKVAGISRLGHMAQVVKSKEAGIRYNTTLQLAPQWSTRREFNKGGMPVGFRNN
jgi:hypothetical protein